MLKRGETVYYTPTGSRDGTSVEGRVLACHRDGTITVEAQFFTNRDGKRLPGYLGYRYRVAECDVRV